MSKYTLYLITLQQRLSHIPAPLWSQPPALSKNTDVLSQALPEPLLVRPAFRQDSCWLLTLGWASLLSPRQQDRIEKNGVVAQLF